MTREQLEHAIRAAWDVAADDAVYVFGSQAILGEYPHAPEQLRQSIEVDIAPVRRLDQIDVIDKSIGELSQFHQTHGFYVHGLPIEAATLPKGWKARLVIVRGEMTNQHTGLCIEGHDLAASKLAAFRDKDREFVRVLLQEHMINGDTLIERIQTLGLVSTEQERRIKWVRLTMQALFDQS